MATLKITTNIPSLEVEIFDSRLQLIPEKYRMKEMATNPHRLVGGTNAFKSVEETLEIELKPDLYKVRLELPYCYPADLKNHEIGSKMSRCVAERLIDLPVDDSVVSLKFNATLIEE
ncbi:MAG: hypothetical protein AABY15_02615 [Nanoarchaeota archaeon]